MGSARRWRAVFGGSTKTSCNKFPSAMHQKKWLDEGSGAPPEPARGPRALPTQSRRAGQKPLRLGVFASLH